MPYKLAKKGSQTCVIKESDGKSMGCHDSSSEAKAQLRALYAAENDRKENDITVNLFVKEAWENYLAETEGDETDEPEQAEEETTEESLDQKSYSYAESSHRGVPFGATSYAELDEMRSAQEQTAKMNDILAEFPLLASNIMMSMEIENKAAAIKKLSEELVSRVGEEAATKAISRRSDVSDADKKRATEEYGDVTYADPKNKKYPIDTEEHIRAAWNYINKSSNASKYSGTEANTIKRRIIAAWKKKIDKGGPPSAKKSWYDTAIEAVTDVLVSIGLVEKEIQEEQQALLIFKEVGGDRWRWLARYSNNFRDDDYVPEIIAAESHRNFVDLVDKGIEPYPELWLWHVPQWRLGQADWLAYDETGFALAAGYFDEGMDDAAEWLSKQVDWKVSHGMPPKSVRRDRLDPTIIIEHVTQEISPLPGWAAANKMTGFVTVSKEADMGIPDKKKEDLLTRLKMPAALLTKIEANNSQDANKAKEEGIESKEKEQPAEAVVEAQTETAVEAETSKTPEAEEIEPEAEKKEAAEVEETDNAEEEPQYATVKEVAETIAEVFNPILKAIDERIANLEQVEAVVKELQKDREVEVKETIANTPANSLLHIMQSSVIGAKGAEVEEGDTLKENKPKETSPQSPGPTPVPFLNSFIQQEN